MILNNKDLKVLMGFTSDYHRRIYGRELSRKLKMNQKTVSNSLNRLEKEDFLKFETQGKNKYYFLNQHNTQIKEVIKMAEINKKLVFLGKYKPLKELINKIENRATGILALFGSYAGGSAHKESDIDLFLIGKISKVDDLEDSYNKKINIVKSTKTKFNKNENFIKEVIKNHVILKGVEGFIELTW
ncbi:MAG: nucleotidyltransferase domain-containing protein [Candidatus Woesearchaeota archaeon]